jgi:formylglycine-generating enzyme required for sulfatase activity
MLETRMAGSGLGLAFAAAAVAFGLGAATARAEPGHLPEAVWIPPGPFVAGSDAAEREAAYRLDEQAYGHSLTRERGWYDAERPRTTLSLPGYHITRTPITNRQYADFVAATGHPAPAVDRDTWDGYGLVHPYGRTRPYQWADGHPPEGKADHPVVLVSHADAVAYAGWLSEATGQSWTLPSELEWEKAARGPDGRRFPWGDAFDPRRLNSHDAGPFATTAVGSFPDGASPYGVLDAAGQVFEWTRTETRPGRFLVKGGSWDDKGCGVCRPAARHPRPAGLKHILIGFRLVRRGS